MAIGSASASPLAPYPSVSACLPQQLSIEVQAGPMVVHHDQPGRRNTYLTNVNAYLTNSSPLPCYLTGDPQAVLVHHREPLPGRYQRENTEIGTDNPTPAAMTAVTSVLSPGASMDEVIGWVGPYCRHPVRAAVRIPLAVGDVVSREIVPSPPCRGAGRGVINTSAWFPLGNGAASFSTP